MKIGELFAVLGFKIEGEKVDKFSNDLQKAHKNALAAKAALFGMVFAVGKLTQATRSYAVELKNFEVQTGLSSDRLEKWRFVAERNDISGKELIGTIKNIQKAQADLKLGEGNIRPWQLLGIDPNEDPFVVLQKIRENIANISPAMAASVISSLGISQNFLNILKKANLEFDGLNEKFLMTEKERKNIIKMNMSFKELIFYARGLRNRFIAINAEPFIAIVSVLKNAASLLLDFVGYIGDLINKFPELENTIIAVAAGLSLYFAPISTAIAGIILLMDDLKTYFEGGDSVTGLMIEKFTKVKVAIEGVLEKFKEITSFGPKGTPLLFQLLGLPLTGGALSKNAQSNSNVNNVSINVNGARSPEITANVVSEQLRQQLDSAYFQIPNVGAA